MNGMQSGASEWVTDHLGVTVEIGGEEWEIDRADGRHAVLRNEQGEQREVPAAQVRALFCRQNMEMHV